MDLCITPKEHPDPWVDHIRGYMTELVRAFTHQGLQIQRCWLDPRDPRDATITYTPSSSPEQLHALVWDEATGCRTGRFISGRQGIRTELAGAVHLGGRVLLDPAEAAARLVTGTSTPRCEFRSYADVRDGFDDQLRQHTG